jgi:hypothetical protein
MSKTLILQLWVREFMIIKQKNLASLWFTAQVNNGFRVIEA